MKVKILKSVGKYMAGQEVEVNDSEAKVLCAVREVQMGGGETEKIRNAVPLEEFKQSKALAAKNIDKMTAKDMADLQMKNVVKTPVGDAFDKKVNKSVEAAKATSSKDSKKQKDDQD